MTTTSVSSRAQGLSAATLALELPPPIALQTSSARSIQLAFTLHQLLEPSPEPLPEPPPPLIRPATTRRNESEPHALSECSRGNAMRSPAGTPISANIIYYI